MNLRAKYGLTVEEYETMYQNQDGRCAACGNEESHRNQWGPIPLAVHHNHKTNKILHLLCHECNTAEGLLKTSERASLLLRYMEENS